MRQRRQYKNPPIQEALVEFQFDGPEDFDVTLFGQLYTQLQTHYPIKRIKHSLEHPIRLGPDGATPLPPRASSINRVQFFSADELDIAAVGVNVLSIHRLRPYTDWRQFKTQVREVHRAYGALAGKPQVRRIGVRYINVVDASDLNRLQELLTMPVGLPAGLPDDLERFLFRFEARYDDRRQLLLTLAQQDEAGVVVDFDVIYAATKDAPLDFDDALSEVEKLRDLERGAFEALITDEARRVFDA